MWGYGRGCRYAFHQHAHAESRQIVKKNIFEKSYYYIISLVVKEEIYFIILLRRHKTCLLLVNLTLNNYIYHILKNGLADNKEASPILPSPPPNSQMVSALSQP